MDDPVKMRREVIEISGERRLYNYTFEISESAATDEPKPSTEGTGNLESDSEAKG